MHLAMRKLARMVAILGGLVLCGLIALTCVSVIGRALGTLAHSDVLANLSQASADALRLSGVGAVNGDFELLEAGIAFAIFAFLPICQLYGAHAKVDVFTSHLPRRANRWLIAFWEGILTAVILLITWRLFAGLQSKFTYGEITFLLQFPVWWAYALSLGAAIVAAIVAVYCATTRCLEAIQDKDILPHLEEASQ